MSDKISRPGRNKAGFVDYKPKREKKNLRKRFFPPFAPFFVFLFFIVLMADMKIKGVYDDAEAEKKDPGKNVKSGN